MDIRPRHRVAPVSGTGAHLLIDEDGAGVARTSAGRFLRLTAPPHRLVEHLCGSEDTGEDGAEPDAQERQAYAAELGAVLGTRRAEDAEARWPAHRRRVSVIGTGGVADDLAAALLDWDVAVTRAPAVDEDLLRRLRGTTSGGTGQTGLVIAYADHPGERAGWDVLDELPGQGTAWLRAHREGETCFVEPLSLTRDDPTSQQVRGRRLAASPVPAELAAWQTLAPPAPLGPGPRALLVARLLDIALAWAQESTRLDRHRHTLWKLVPATGAMSEHTLLGYPAPFAGAPREGMG